MCGRFTISKTEEELERRFAATFYTKVLEARYNIAPTRRTPVITDADPDHIQAYRWGLVPFWAKDPGIGARMINARIETVGEKPAFRSAFRKRRCLVLADGWYEWKLIGKRKQPFRILRKDREAFAMAGLWESWKPKNEKNGSDGGGAANGKAQSTDRGTKSANAAGLPLDEEGRLHSFTIITQPAVEAIAHIHDRMPSVLLPEHERTWLEEALPDEDLRQLLVPFPGDQLEAYPVSTAVNNARNEAEELLEEVDPEQPTEGLFG